MSGSLVLVGTPIGNLGDLSPRAVEELAGADVIVCEDTRRSRGLLTHAGVGGRRLLAMDSHQEARRAGGIVELVRQGQTVALITDAGMPGVSDPGSRLVAAVVAAGLAVRVVPGPSAVTAALVLSGLSTDRFAFEGFLPRKGPERRARLAEVARSGATTVIFESPLRLAATLTDLVGACGPERQVAVMRELTKLYEDVWRGSLAEAAELSGAFPARGEHVVVVAGRPPGSAPVTDEDIVAALTQQLETGASARDASRRVAEALAVPKRRAYDLALGLRSDA